MYRRSMLINAKKEFIDITEKLNQHIKLSGIKNGMIYLHTMHTTFGLKIIENELLSLCDIDDFLNKYIPFNSEYKHNKIKLRQVPPNERLNGASHIRMLFFNTDLALPIKNGKLLLGKWQKVFAIEMDCDQKKVRLREIIITITK